jgi:hypothetical protein
MRDNDRIVATIGDLDPFEEGRARKLARRVVVHAIDPTSQMMGIASPESDDDGPVFVPTIGPALAFPEKEAGVVTTPAPKATPGTPKPAVPKKDAWKLGNGRYILQRGDTFWGLGVTYLGSGPRWKELRAFQPEDWKARNPDPNLIREGDVILMPKDAQDRARALGLLPNVAGFSVGKVALGALVSLVAGAGSYLAGSRS